MNFSPHAISRIADHHYTPGSIQPEFPQAFVEGVQEVIKKGENEQISCCADCIGKQWMEAFDHPERNSHSAFAKGRNTQ